MHRDLERKTIELYLRAWNTQEVIADRLNIIQQTISNIINDLAKNGEIARICKDFISQIYDVVEKLHLQEIDQPQRKNPQHNICHGSFFADAHEGVASSTASVILKTGTPLAGPRRHISENPRSCRRSHNIEEDLRHCFFNYIIRP